MSIGCSFFFLLPSALYVHIEKDYPKNKKRSKRNEKTYLKRLRSTCSIELSTQRLLCFSDWSRRTELLKTFRQSVSRHSYLKKLFAAFSPSRLITFDLVWSALIWFRHSSRRTKKDLNKHRSFNVGTESLTMSDNLKRFRTNKALIKNVRLHNTLREEKRDRSRQKKMPQKTSTVDWKVPLGKGQAA